MVILLLLAIICSYNITSYPCLTYKRKKSFHYLEIFKNEKEENSLKNYIDRYKLIKRNRLNIYPFKTYNLINTLKNGNYNFNKNIKKDGFYITKFIVQLSLFCKEKKKKNNKKKNIFNNSNCYRYSYIVVYSNESLLQHCRCTPQYKKIIFDNRFKGCRLKEEKNINILGFYNTNNRRIHNCSLDISRSDENDTSNKIKNKNKRGEKLIKHNNNDNINKDDNNNNNNNMDRMDNISIKKDSACSNNSQINHNNNINNMNNSNNGDHIHRSKEERSFENVLSQYNKDLILSKSKIVHLDFPVCRMNSSNMVTMDDIFYGGFLNIYKPVKLYSMKVCEKIKRILKDYFYKLYKKKVNIKVGHGGTLDPFAEGVLIIGIQQGTKKLSDFLKCYKKYLALSIFGYETDTLDREGKIIKEEHVIHKKLKKQDILTNLQKFIGNIEQYPPIYSAKRFKGLRLYEYARKNISVQIKPSNVYIKDIQYYNQIEFPFFDFYIHCSGGTYIRSLIRDFANSLNTNATLIKLVRIQQNEFNYKNSLHYDDINIDNIKKYFIKL
ncbi:tRNA pseudouridine synthase, putative [Plasmodium gaboni]|uniref:tRNA pseudouridine(55) synthase n=1 Tax=Plasmodium gaboni TaxID=647221 RepID=A0ABY1UMX3_9APIC|nr:tRNA pseudouridine synthase, putative [Plasmodium gaboni]